MTEHCAGCHGTDYLGRQCRGRDIDAIRQSRDEANEDAERLAAALERVADVVATESQAPTYVLDALRQHDERVSRDTVVPHSEKHR